MVRAVFVNQLQELQEQVVLMSSQVSQAVRYAIDALRLQDIETARHVIDGDMQINQRRWEIEEQALVVIATQAPMASDLRFVSSVIHITSELERMADHAVGIARIAVDTAALPPLKPLIDIPRMADMGLAMLSESIEAFERHDAIAARAIAARDAGVDALYDQTYRELLILMMADTSTINRATYLLRVAHNLERIADRVTNICERVVFTSTGVLEELPHSA